MNVTLYYLDLPLAYPFTIARGSITSQPSLIVCLEQNGIFGYGEVTENSYYGHTFDSMTSSLRAGAAALAELRSSSPAEAWTHLCRVMQDDLFALSALDIAAHDLRGKQRQVSTWQDWGLHWQDVPQSSYTIGIDTIDRMVAKLAEQPDWEIYKIKLGTVQDLEIVRELRRHTSARFRVDANCGWTAEQTIANSQALAECGVEFIEQPLPTTATDADKLRVYQYSSLPVIADEDCQQVEDIARCAGLYHGVNVKVCKCGGLTPALQMLRQARQLGLQTMVGCMVETSIAISAAAQLLPLLDYADLDGAVLLRDQPAAGVEIDNGKVRMSSLPGCGAALQADRLEPFLIRPPLQL